MRYAIMKSALWRQWWPKIGHGIRRHLVFICAMALAGGVGPCVEAAGGENAALPPKKIDWSFKGIFGTFDRAELQRGFQVYKQVCATCHSLNWLRYEKLSALGFSEEEIKVIASEYEVPGPLNEDGEPTFKRAEKGDYFWKPYPNEKAARAANNGAYPVDLSLITKARRNGADYLYALLVGYQAPPADVTMMPGLYYNPYYDGHQIAMPAPLSEGLVSYSDGTKATVEQMAHDVTAFLAWASEPEMEERKQLGIKVSIYLLFFIVLMYMMMQRVWRRVS